MMEALIHISLQIITGCSKKLMCNWSIIEFIVVPPLMELER